MRRNLGRFWKTKNAIFAFFLVWQCSWLLPQVSKAPAANRGNGGAETFSLAPVEHGRFSETFSLPPDEHGRSLVQTSETPISRLTRQMFLPRKKVARKASLFDLQALGMNALEEDAFTFLGAAVVVYPFCRLFGLSPLLGFILAGMLLRETNLFAKDRDEAILADFGVLCLLFQIGLELTFDKLQRLSKYAFNIGLAALILSTACFASFELPVGEGMVTRMLENFAGARPGLFSINSFVEAIVVGAGISLSSSAFVMQLLSDQQELKSRLGGAVVGVLLIQDIAVVPLLVLLPIVQEFQSSGSGTDSFESFYALAGNAVQSLTVLVIVTLASKFIAKPLLSKTAEEFGSQSDALSATVLFTVVLASLGTKAAGLSDSLGAFLIGTLLADSEQKLRIEEAIIPYKGLLLGLFFLTVGASLDMSVLLECWRPILTLLVGICFVKAIIFAVLAKTCTDLSQRESVRVAMLLAQGGEFAFVVFQLADDLKILPDDLNKVLLIVTSLSIAMTPVLDMIGVAIASRLPDQDDGGKPALSR